MTEPQTEPAAEVLFAEKGASKWLLVIGPIAAATMMGIQLSSGFGWSPVMPGVFLLVMTGFLGIQIKAARLHTSVELTSSYLRQGTETILISEIVRVYPEAEGGDVPAWQSARALGELMGVPRRRTGVGLRLSNDRTAQAWARRHRELRRVLDSLVDA